MSTIKSIETLVVQLPTRREHKWTGLTEVIGRYMLVKMTDSDGRVGWGEAAAGKKQAREGLARVMLEHHRMTAPIQHAAREAADCVGEVWASADGKIHQGADNRAI